MTTGRISANNQLLTAGDQARVDIDQPLVLLADEASELIVVDVPSCKGWGYDDDTLNGTKR